MRTGVSHHQKGDEAKRSECINRVSRLNEKVSNIKEICKGAKTKISCKGKNNEDKIISKTNV